MSTELHVTFIKRQYFYVCLANVWCDTFMISNLNFTWQIPNMIRYGAISTGQFNAADFPNLLLHYIANFFTGIFLCIFILMMYYRSILLNFFQCVRAFILIRFIFWVGKLSWPFLFPPWFLYFYVKQLFVYT